MSDDASGMVFTDKTGQVVFVNKHFYQMMDYQPQADRLVGLPLDRVLRIPASLARRLAEEPREGAPVEMVIAPEGHGFSLRVRSEAAFDDRKAFIGSNIAVNYTKEAAERLRRGTTNDAQHLETYFLAVLEALQVLLARMGGLNVRQVVDEIVLEHAQREGWGVAIPEGQFSLSTSTTLAQRALIYRAVLEDVLEYAFDVVGAFLVEGAVAEAEAALPPEALAAAATHDLRHLL